MAAALAVVLLLAVPSSAWEYGIMIDAGSGGTRLHFYRWPERVADPLRPLYPAVTVPEELFEVGCHPGISSFAHNISGLEPYMQSLLSQAEHRLAGMREQWYLIPVYMKATAGARNLYQDQRDAIFAKLRGILASSPFRFDDFYWARTISGEEEAVYAWLAVNAIKGTYRQDPAQTWGALDMGGASTQIAFIPKGISIIQNFYPLHISSKMVHLYSHSYLEFGYRDARQRLLRGLMHWGYGNGTRDDPILSPCAPKGSLFRHNFSEAFAIGRTRFWVKGTGNLPECKRMATKLLRPNARCYVPAESREFAIDSRKGACAINGVYEPKLEGRKFVATGQYAGQARKLGLPSGQLIAMRKWMDAVEVQCTEKHWPDYCWRSIWLGLVVTEGLRFDLDEKKIMFSTEIDGQQTAWALGAMMNEVNFYPWRSSASKSPYGFAAEPVTPPSVLATPALLAGVAAISASVSGAAVWLLLKRRVSSLPLAAFADRHGGAFLVA